MSAPQFVTRSGWAAAPPKSAWTPWPIGQPSGHTIHWEGAGGHADHSKCASEVRAIQAYHQNGVYIDIAYNWIVCMHGAIFDGRPQRFESAAQRGGNSLRIAICYMAGPSWPFSEAAKAAILWLIEHGPIGTVKAIPHADEPTCVTSCAGDVINGWVRAGKYTVAPVSAFPVPAPKPLPLPAGGFHHPVLKQPSHGPAVLELQWKLNFAAGQHLVSDGFYGPNTAVSVTNLQRFFKLNADGVAGPKTWGILDYIVALKRHRH